MIDKYFAELDALIHQSDIVTEHISISYEQRAVYIGYVRGTLRMVDGTILHFREYVDVDGGIERYTYSYHYQRADATIIFRYYNVAHYPDLPNFPHHKHDGDEGNVSSVSQPDLSSVLLEIQQLLAI